MVHPIKEERTYQKIVTEKITVGYRCEHCKSEHLKFYEAEECEKKCLVEFRKTCKHEECEYYAYIDNNHGYDDSTLNVVKVCNSCDHSVTKSLDLSNEENLMNLFDKIYDI